MSWYNYQLTILDFETSAIIYVVINIVWALPRAHCFEFLLLFLFSSVLLSFVPFFCRIPRLKTELFINIAFPCFSLYFRHFERLTWENLEPTELIKLTFIPYIICLLSLSTPVPTRHFLFSVLREYWSDGILVGSYIHYFYEAPQYLEVLIPLIIGNILLWFKIKRAVFLWIAGFLCLYSVQLVGQIIDAQEVLEQQYQAWGF